MKLRIGAVSYLNTKPLIFGFERHLPGCSLELDLPSRLADRLASGQLDVALIPSVEYFRSRTGVIASDACIACRGPVWSVQLWCKKPPQRIQTLALDEGSRTSVALVQVLLWERFRIRPRCEILPIGSQPESCDTDAVLVIGDRAIRRAPEGLEAVWDLGDEWCRHAELPFVFAMWVARNDRIADEVASALQSSRDDGIEHLQQIAEQAALVYPFSGADCLKYLRDNLHFQLGPAELDGLNVFHRCALKLGLVPATREEVLWPATQ